MKTYLLRLGFVVLLVASMTNLHAQNRQINFTSPAFEIAKTSTGTALTTSYTFALGSFGTFTPTAVNESSWAASFTTLATIAWDDGFTQYSQVANLTTNAAPFSLSNQAYVWGYNTQTIAGGTEWILLTNSSWTFPVIGTALAPVNWDASDVGTVAVVGSIAGSLGSNPYMQTASVAAIPEPSTYAAIFGALALGFVAYRRRSAA